VRPLFVCLSLVATSIADAAAQTVVPGPASIQLNGDAQLGQSLVLTNGPSQLSSAWYETPLSLASPFRVTFSYRAEPASPFFPVGGGFGLVLQAAPSGPGTLGQAGDPGFGYGGISNSLGLVVDLQGKTLRLLENGGNTALINRTDWNTRDANGVWEHGVPGYPLPAGVDPDVSPPICQVNVTASAVSCTVGGIDMDMGASIRLYDHYYVGHGFASGSDLPSVADGDWLQFQATFLPNVSDGSVAVLYEFGNAANGAGYLGVLDYFYLPGTPLAPDGSFFAGLPEYTPASAPYFVGFTASTGSTEFSEQTIRDWRIETGIENTYLNYVHPVASAAAVPQPGTVSLLGIGLLALLGRWRTRSAGVSTQTLGTKQHSAVVSR
jgi:hypothetical protein